ncbi:MAG: DNA polymerase II [Ignavibacteriales bacterium]|nr:DNA polymerase II [Ignavibacteriales bacterium]
MTELKIFILTGEWIDTRGQNVLRFVGKSPEEKLPIEVVITNNKPVFFVENSSELPNTNLSFNRKQLSFKTFSGQLVDALYFNSQNELKQFSEKCDEQNILTYESDVDPVKRFLMEKFVNAQIKLSGESQVKDDVIKFINPKVEPCEVNPDFTICSLDIETGMKNNLLYSIAVHLTSKGSEEKKVFMIGDQSKRKPAHILFYENEKTLLTEFFNWFRNADPDIIIGWHVIGFDLLFIENKCKENFIPFDIARCKGKAVIRKRKAGGYFASVTGRIIIDGPPTLRASFFNFEDYKLETVAQEILKEGKTITPDQNKVAEIERLFKEDKLTLAEYNLNDCMLVTNIFQQTGLIELSIKRAQLSGLLMDQLGMMTQAFDHFYLPRLHRAGYVAPNVKDLQTSDHAAGGYVLDPTPGIYENVVVLDFKSLYPSIILTFKIDPLSRLLSDIDTIETPNRIKFSSTKYLLPQFIEQLMKQRTFAKKKNDAQLSQAIKILMNSFYGVMGSYGCRFYHPDLPTAITGTGQYLLLQSKKFLEQNEYKVVYGDTDSLFVKLKNNEGDDGEASGKKITTLLNKFWKQKLKDEFNVESHLEIEYEKFYKKFIITPARGSEAGAKKRYAGLIEKNGNQQVDFVGLESVRSDWTRLAKDFQLELYNRVFNNIEIENWLREIVQKVYAGEYDTKLVYRKRLRKDVVDYTKNIPQHVRAARLIDQSSGTVYYVITKRGPVPIELKHTDIDYQHYIEKQLKPIADSILSLLGKSFDNIVQSGQLSFF